MNPKPPSKPKPGDQKPNRAADAVTGVLRNMQGAAAAGLEWVPLQTLAQARDSQGQFVMPMYLRTVRRLAGAIAKDTSVVLDASKTHVRLLQPLERLRTFMERELGNSQTLPVEALLENPGAAPILIALGFDPLVIRNVVGM